MECEDSTDLKDQYPVISGATWELVDNWDCAGNDIDSEAASGLIIIELPGTTDTRALCAKKCLEAANCVAFNYPKLGGKCWWKHTNQKSTQLGKTCGSSSEDRQYYTLLDKDPQNCLN